jgi:probable phosphoglycerate mutase
VAETLPVVFPARHGEIAWTLPGQCTGRTDPPSTEAGERDARVIGAGLRGLVFAKPFTSPLRSALRTCEPTGFGGAAELDPDLMGWDDGHYEGRRTVEILAPRPDGSCSATAALGGESPVKIGARTDRVVSRLRAVQSDVLLFSSAHFLRVLSARWLGLEPAGGGHLLLSTASLSTPGCEHNSTKPAIRPWNNTHHLDRA